MASRRGKRQCKCQSSRDVPLLVMAATTRGRKRYIKAQCPDCAHVHIWAMQDGVFLADAGAHVTYTHDAKRTR